MGYKCRHIESCPLDVHCFTKNIIYKAKVGDDDDSSVQISVYYINSKFKLDGFSMVSILSTGA